MCCLVSSWSRSSYIRSEDCAPAIDVGVAAEGGVPVHARNESAALVGAASLAPPD